ncbi:MAG: glycosyltransferase family 2 protein [Candidatus Omnitrophica bacterium]|nr:glycosyltransferase family 2 protein [Candidatus Omnitrophota bacterium]
MKVWIIIPAYNEADSLGVLLNSLNKKGFSVLVVDDGSFDKTYQTAKKYATVVLRNKRNFGKGLSIKTAVEYLLKNEKFDYIITMDADGQHSPDDVDNFIAQASKGEACVVGNRMDNPIGMPGLRITTNKVMSKIVSRIARQSIPDTQCGFRLIKREILEAIKLRTRKFEIESEILIKASRAGYPIKSIPIKSIYFKNQHSKINPFTDTIRFFGFISRLKK